MIVHVELSTMSNCINDCDEPSLCNLSVRMVVKLFTLGVFALVMNLVS